jgi:branched-chain amino acid transport system ATP-binding protein
MAALLECRGLVAGYDSVPVVHGIDLRVGAGEVVALLGANGAGKTTTLLTVSALLAPLGGETVVLGRRVQPARTMARRTIARRAIALARAGVAHVPDDRSLFPGLTVAEHLRLAAGRDRAAAAGALDVFPALAALARRRAGLLSGGEQQMLAVARALAGRPRLLLIDEMSLGLAPIVVEQLLPAVRSIATDRGVGVLLVEQQVPAALAVSDRAYVLRRGRVAAAGTAAELARDPELLAASYLGDSS